MNIQWLQDCAPLNVAQSSTWGDGATVVVQLTREHLQQASQALKDQGFYLEFMTALDVEEGFVLTYLFSSWREKERIVLRVLLDHDAPEVPSLASIHPGADWHERECRDFFGILFIGHLCNDPLLLPVDVQTHPLRKKAGMRKSVSILLPAEQIVPASAEVQNNVVQTLTETARERRNPSRTS